MGVRHAPFTRKEVSIAPFQFEPVELVAELVVERLLTSGPSTHTSGVKPSHPRSNRPPCRTWLGVGRIGVEDQAASYGRYLHLVRPSLPDAEFGTLSRPHFGTFIWTRLRPIAARAFGLFGVRMRGGRRSAIEDGAVRADQARPRR